MVPQGGREDSPLNRLLQGATGFDFFQAVRVLERSHAALTGKDAPNGNGSASPGAVGRDEPPHGEAVRFRSMVSLSFPPTEVVELKPGAAPLGHAPIAAKRRRPLELVISFMGLMGPAGAMPRHYTSLLIDRVRNKDYALRDFWDLFNHRLVSLFYRAWEKYRLAAAYERVRLEGERARDVSTGAVKEDGITSALYALIGMGTIGLRERLAFSDEVLVHYAGAFAHCPRNAASLAQAIGDYFGLKAKINQFQGQWLYLSEEARSRLPTGPGKPTAGALGVDTVVGEKVWDVQAKFRVRLGPLTYSEFKRFIPGGDGLRSLGQLVRTYAGPEYDFDVQPVLHKDHIPSSMLGGDGMLGRNVFMKSAAFKDHFEAAVFPADGN
jgi:type VI secretion system protein ImpH